MHSGLRNVHGEQRPEVKATIPLKNPGRTRSHRKEIYGKLVLTICIIERMKFNHCKSKRK
jgi:hypothetical protein